MARLVIDITATANNSNGDSIRAAFSKINSNFRELYENTSDGNYNIESIRFNGDNVVVTGISADSSMSGYSDFKLSTQKAVVEYISSRLGVNHAGNIVDNPLHGGFMDRKGLLPYAGGATPMSLGGSRIANLGQPTSSTDATNKQYVDSRYLFSTDYFASAVVGGVQTIKFKDFPPRSVLANATASASSPEIVSMAELVAASFGKHPTLPVVNITLPTGNIGNKVISNGDVSDSVVNVSVDGSVTFSKVKAVSGGSVFSGSWTLSNGSTLRSTYADLAECYTSDRIYDVGTVVVFGGDKEVTISTISDDFRVAGVITKDPAYILNAELEGTVACIALQGRTPVKVIGLACKGDILVSAGLGFAKVNNSPRAGTIIGKCLERKDTFEPQLIEVAVGRF